MIVLYKRGYYHVNVEVYVYESLEAYKREQEENEEIFEMIKQRQETDTGERYSLEFLEALLDKRDR